MRKRRIHKVLYGDHVQLRSIFLRILSPKDTATMEGAYDSRKGRLTTFWEERRVIFICFLIGFSQFQYGYDSAAVAGFQSMPGFLQIYGYPDVG
jgi:hypothetical protein